MTSESASWTSGKSTEKPISHSDLKQKNIITAEPAGTQTREFSSTNIDGELEAIREDTQVKLKTAVPKYKYSLRPRKHESKIFLQSNDTVCSNTYLTEPLEIEKKRAIMESNENRSSKKSASKITPKPKKRIASAARAVQSLLRITKKQSSSGSRMPVCNYLNSVMPEVPKSVPGVKPSNEIVMLPEVKVPATDVLLNYTDALTSFPEVEECCICCEKLETICDCNDTVISLKDCKHMFHKSCVIAMYSSGIQDGSMQCPVCKFIYGLKTGNQPSGTMDYYVIPYSLPGFQSCDTICINYHIIPGIQNVSHSHPGKPFTCRGFPRRCYLPDNEDGRKVLSLLIIAWERRLIFTVGTSATTGEEDTVTWNEIHHKTEFGSNITGHGFPDPSYFDNVLLELALQGVVPLTEEAHCACVL